MSIRHFLRFTIFQLNKIKKFNMSTSKSQILVTNSIIYYSEVTESLVVGIGNPLLDISVMVDDEFLKKYDLKPNDAIMADSKHLPLYKEITEK